MEHALGDLLRRRLMIDNGDTPLPLVWDEDVADAAVLAVQQGARGAFNLAADEPAPAAALARDAGLRLVKFPRALAAGFAYLSPALERLGVGRAVDPAWVRETRTTMIMSAARARAELGWKPRCPTVRDVLRRYVDTVPGRLDRRIDIFLRLLALAGRRAVDLPAEAERISAQIHLQLTGPRGGDIGIHFDHGRITIERRAPRPPSAVVTMKAETFLALIAGRLDSATAGLTGKIRIEGEGLTGLLVQGIVSLYRARLNVAGPAGFATRQLDRWFAKGVAP
jgi:putative sterol carrier protein